MVDREAREALAECTRLYLEHEVQADELFDVADMYLHSSDQALKEFAQAMTLDLFEQGDIGLCPERMPKPTWDAIQRYLLLLDSDFQIQDSHSYIWTGWQVVALAGVLLFVVAAQLLGVAAALAWLSVPSAALSYWISKKKSEKLPVSPYQELLEPFDSFQSLRAALCQVRDQHGFEKMKFPGKACKPSYDAHRFSIVSHFLILIMLPTVLFLPFQAFPIQRIDRRCTFAG